MNEREKLFDEMCEIISDHSQDCYCAGWLDGIEFTVLTWLDELEAGRYDEFGRFGISTRIPKEKLEKLRIIALANDMWPVWGDGEGAPGIRTLAQARLLREDYRAKWDRMILKGKWGVSGAGGLLDELR